MIKKTLLLVLIFCGVGICFEGDCGYGVTGITAGSGVNVSPTNGKGNVTINANVGVSTGVVFVEGKQNVSGSKTFKASSNTFTADLEIQNQLYTKFLLVNTSATIKNLTVTDSITLPVIYSTDSVSIVFASTYIATGVLVYKDTVTFTLPCNMLMKQAKITSVISGTVGIVISSAATAGGTFVVISTGETLVTSNDYSSDLNHWVGTKIFAAGTVMKLYLNDLAIASTNKVTLTLIYWKTLW